MKNKPALFSVQTHRRARHINARRTAPLLGVIVSLLFSLLPIQGGLSAATRGQTADPPPAATDADSTGNFTGNFTGDFAPGEVLVGVRRDAPLFSARGKDGAAAREELAGLAGIALAAVEELTITDAADAPRFFRLGVEPGAEMATIERLRGDPSVAFTEPNWIVRAAVVGSGESPTPVLPSDPLFRANQWGMQRIGAPRAWAISQGAALRVAVIDSGIDFSHPEFAGRLLAGKNYVTPGLSPHDDSGHGTHVAGIIAAALNNGVGVAGLAPRVLIDPRKALNSNNAGTVSNIAQAIRDAADDGARIINLSVTVSENSAVLEAAVNYAVGKGVLLVGAAGNAAPNPVWWPAAYAGVMAVGATDMADQRTYYSHTGAVDLAAPGGLSSQLIYSTWPTGIKCSTVAPTGYCTAFGTSMSAAYVSGAAALVWGTRPDLTLVQVRNLLLETARKTGAPSTDVGAGRLDAQAAVRQALLSDIQLSQSSLARLAAVGSQPFTETLTLANPSGDLLFWQASVTSGSQWLDVRPATARSNHSIRYGEPAQLSLVITPTLLAASDYTGSIQVVASRSSGSQINLTVPVNLFVRSSLRSSWLAMTSRLSLPLEWQTPNAGGKQAVQLTDNSSIGLLLPFTYTVESQAVTTVRLYADGFLTFPASESVDSLPVACTPDETAAGQAIYGWWSDLNPGLGGTVSTFTSTAGAFVAEFLDVPLASAPEERVRFQMALFADGRVQLSYAALPSAAGDVAVGMEVSGGLLSTRIACRRGSTQLGVLPVAGETITILPTDWR
ncbi:MAG: S8 family serine peptidase [Caldilineaceae bacterium]